MKKTKKPIAAKKASPVKKKTQALPAKKAAPKPAKKAVPVKKAAAKTPAKAPVKTAASKAAPKKEAPKAAPKKAAAPVSKPASKPSKPEPVKAPAKAAKPAPAAAAKPAPAPAKAPKKVEAKAEPKKVEAKAAPKEEIVEETEVSAKGDAPKVAKARKGKEVEVVEAEPEEEVVLLDAEGRRYCRVKDCDQASTVDGYCRYHYLLFWKNIQNRKSILAEGKLERYIEELTARYPDKYLEMLKKDLRSEKEFLAAIQELEIDEAAVDSDYEDEAQNYLDEVRGMSTESGEGGRGDDDSY